MIRRQIELAGTTRDAGTVLDAHQPFVFAQVLSGFDRVGGERSVGHFNFTEHFGQRVLCDIGTAAKRIEHLALTLQFLHEIRFEVGATGDIEDVKDRHQRSVMLKRVFERDEMLRFCE